MPAARPSPAAPAPAAPAGSAIAAAAARYDGAGYVYGGPAARVGDWDCSSFVSWVLGHDLGMGLPGGRWGGPGMPPAVHGPVVLSYVSWAGADPVPSGQEQPGDLVCWPGVGAGGHMGVVLGVNQMCSALNPQLGTKISPIAGWGPPGPWVFRRVKGTGAAPVLTAAGQGSAGSLLGPLIIGVLVGGGAIVIVLGVAAAAAAGLVWLAARGAQRAAAGPAGGG